MIRLVLFWIAQCGLVSDRSAAISALPGVRLQPPDWKLVSNTPRFSSFDSYTATSLQQGVSFKSSTAYSCLPLEVATLGSELFFQQINNATILIKHRGVEAFVSQLNFQLLGLELQGLQL